MKKTCFILTAIIVAMNPASLFAGETMVTQTTRPPTKCDFRVDKCETSVATDPSYLRFKDGTPIPGPADISPATGDPGFYCSSYAFQDYQSPTKSPTLEELLALIQKKLSNCPEVEFTFDEDTGDITIHYLHSDCDCNCDWTINVRNVKADDFVWKRTTDNYSPRLGQMERRKFHTTSEKDAQDIESACAQICAIKNWPISKD
jgi:hypothetical protein